MLAYARLLVEIEVHREFLENILLVRTNKNECFQKIEYEGRRVKCTFYVIGSMRIKHKSIVNIVVNDEK